MSKVNQVFIKGRIVEEELNYIPGSGTPVLKLRVLVDDGYYDTKKQEYVKRNIYRTVKYINDLADKLGLKEDDWVLVAGSMATDSWEDRDGNKKYSDYIRATLVDEVPDPWELKKSGGGDDRRGSDRGRGGRDERSGRDRGGRDRGSRDRGRGRDDRRGRDESRDRRDGRGDDRDRDREIPF